MRRTFPSFIMMLLLAADSAALLVAAPAMATTPTTHSPAPAPSGRVQGPPDGLIPPAPAPGGPRSAPFPFPLPGRPAPTPPAPAPAPTPTATAPSVSQPTPRHRAAPLVHPPAPVAVPDGLNTPITSGAAAPPASPGDASTVPLPAAAPSASETHESAIAWPEWAPLAAIGGVAVVLLGLWIWTRRRRNRPLALPAPEVEEATAPAPPAPAAKPERPAAIPAAPRSIIGKRAELSMRFEALAAQSTLLNFRLRYAITLVNIGPVDAANVAVRIGLFAGTQASENGIAQWLMLPDQGAHHMVETIAAGSEHRFEGELAAPLDALGPMTVEGRTLAIALMAIDARYHHPLGEAPLDGQVARAFVVGREPASSGNGSGKLVPFRLDQGPTSFAPLGTRDTNISRNE